MLQKNHLFTHHLFNPGNDIYFITDIDQTLNVDTTFSPKKYLSNELNLYIENDIKFNILKANIGISKILTIGRNYGKSY